MERRFINRIILAGLLFFQSSAHAFPVSFEENLLKATLGETLPGVTFEPVHSLTLEEFSWEIKGPSAKDIRMEWVPDSLEWVNANDLLKLPRGRVRITLPSSAATQTLQYAGFTTQFSGSTELTVALFEYPSNSIELPLLHTTLKLTHQLKTPIIWFDASCSAFGVTLTAIQTPRPVFAIGGCRLVRDSQTNGEAPSLEVYLVLSEGENFRKFRISPNDQKPLHIEAPNGFSANLSHFLPKKLYRFNFGLGLGPYTYNYNLPEHKESSVVVLPTLYLSYFLDETSRIVLFDATPIHRTTFSDNGLYYVTEQLKLFDRLLSLNLMLGAHTLTYKTISGYQTAFSAPQGFELIFKDLLGAGRNLSSGGFIYPPFNNRSYYNVWLRLGTRSIFWELNYISWQEPLGPTENANSKSVGISVGLPLSRWIRP